MADESFTLDGKRLLPVEDQILELFGDSNNFSARDVINLLGLRESERTIYRAIERLQTEGRITYLRTLGRVKLYTAKGTSKLPQFKAYDSPAYHPISVYLKNIKEIYPNDKWAKAEFINNLPSTIVRLFVIAQNSDNVKQQRQDFTKAMHTLAEMRRTLTWMVDLIDSVLKHPVMSSPGMLTQILTDHDDPAMPTMAEINNFKVWYVEYTRREQQRQNARNPGNEENQPGNGA